MLTITTWVSSLFLLLTNILGYSTITHNIYGFHSFIHPSHPPSHSMAGISQSRTFSLSQYMFKYITLPFCTTFVAQPNLTICTAPYFINNFANTFRFKCALITQAYQGRPLLLHESSYD